MASRLLRPRLIVFDLDHTLWPLGVDEFLFRPPFARFASPDAGIRVLDGRGVEMSLFPQTPQLLHRIRMLGKEANDIRMAVASRTAFPQGAKHLLKLFHISSFLAYKEIYPGRKVAHFQSLNRQSAIPYSEMLFFDDEERNIQDVSQLGVTAVRVNPARGITLQDLDEALHDFSRK